MLGEIPTSFDKCFSPWLSEDRVLTGIGDLQTDHLAMRSLDRYLAHIQWNEPHG